MVKLASANKMANSKFVRMAITTRKQPRHIQWESYVVHCPRRECKFYYSERPRTIISSSVCSLALHQLQFYHGREAEDLQAQPHRAGTGSHITQRIRSCVPTQPTSPLS